MTNINILMVCLGNICRSPMAQGILQHYLNLYQLNGTVDSAGTYSGHAGEPPHRSSIKTCKAHGINISDQRARPFHLDDFEKFDLIYAMDIEVRNTLISKTLNELYQSKVKLFMDESHNGEMISVPDPWYGTEKDFESVYQMLEANMKSILKNHFNVLH